MQDSIAGIQKDTRSCRIDAVSIGLQAVLGSHALFKNMGRSMRVEIYHQITLEEVPRGTWDVEFETRHSISY